MPATKPTKDSLTGLLSRHSLQLHRSELEANRTGFALLFVDVDHFKNFNDKWGHDAGDLVLRDIATHLGKNLPAESRIARLGGDEFVVIVCGLGIGSATELAESIRRGFADAFETATGLTASIGVVITPPHSQWTAAEALGLADARLVVAKKRLSPGRNRVRGGDLPPDWRGRWSDWPSAGA